MEKKILPIKGMHCRSCEILIEDKLNKIPGLKGISVSYKQEKAEFFLNYPATMNQIESAISDAGYEVGEEKKAWINTNPAEYKDLLIAIVILTILYIIGRKVGLFNINIGSNSNPSSLIIVLLVGLTAGVSTCMALVGGLILGISARHAEKHPEATPAQKFRPHLFFNLGRISSYALLGGVIGLIGKAFQLSSTILGTLMILVGIVMLILGIQLTELFPRISSAGFTLPSSLSKLFGIKRRHSREYSHWNSFITGALTFFLPCGFTQTMQLYAMSTGNFFSGMAIMGVFALGTAPGLLGIGGLTSIIKGAFAKKFFKFAGLLVVVLAILNISNGFNLTGWKGISLGNDVSSSSAVKIENGFQIVEMTQDTRGYNPSSFTIKKDIPVKWIIDSKDPGSCSSSLVSSKINVKQFLAKGENTIEFTPNEVGTINFSCSMGMYRGKFNVIENNDNVSTDVSSSQNSAPPKETPSVAPNENTKDLQIIKARYVDASIYDDSDIIPHEFTISVGKPVRFEVYPEIDGIGCMSSIAIPKLASNFEYLQKGKTVVFEFTPKEKGSYNITCAMGSIRGKIIVN